MPSAAKPFFQASPPGNVRIGLIGYGLPYLDKIHDRKSVIERLSSTNPAEWCASSYSERIRLLPLLLLSAGQSSKALEFVNDVAQEAECHDQIIPPYFEFANWLRLAVAEASATKKRTGGE